MQSVRISVVVAHAAHLLSILGMVTRWRPEVLILTQSDTTLGKQQANVIQAGLHMVGLADRVTYLGIDEVTSYRQALAGNFSFHIEALPRITAWLERVEPEAVFGDAFELTNYQHDVGRLLLDAAVTKHRARGLRLRSYEIPLSVQPSLPCGPLQFGSFLSGPFERFRLTAAEAGLKQRVVDWASTVDSFVGKVAPLFPGLDVEIYREVRLIAIMPCRPLGLRVTMMLAAAKKFRWAVTKKRLPSIITSVR